MLDIETRLASLKRPALLARAARFGADDYQRDIHLARLLDTETLPKPAEALMALFSREAEINGWRLAKAGLYRPARHVETLIAIMGEAQLFRATTRHV